MVGFEARQADILLELLLNVLLLAFAIALIVSLLLSKQQRRQKPILRTRIECLSCGYAVEREYRKGDYVGMDAGVCPRCGGKMIIVAVFEVRPEERREEERLLRLVERRQQYGSRGMQRSV